jgi:hypothetical protein
LRVRSLLTAAACLALAGLSLLVPSAPTTDPWGWIVWGREIVHGQLDTIVPGAPSWKPLPMLATIPLALTGSSAPVLWLLIERAAGLASLVVAYRLGSRLAGRFAGVLAAAGLVATDGWVREFAHGYTEPLSIGLLLAAADAHLSRRPRLAIVLGGFVALARPEAIALLGLYGLVLWRRGERFLALLGSTAAAVVALWVVPDWIGSGDPLHASKVARRVVPTGFQASVNAISGSARILPLPLLAFAAAAVFIALRRRDRAIVELTALAAAWCALLVAMMFAGYPASIRFFALPTALLGVVGAVGAVQLVEALPARRARAAMAAALALVSAQSAVLRTTLVADDAQASVTRAQVEEDLATTVGRARTAIRACGIPVLPGGIFWAKGAVAWELNLPLHDVRTVRAHAPRYLERVSEPRDHPLPRLNSDRRVTVTTHRRHFVLLAPFGSAQVHLPRRKLTTIAAAGPWRAETLARASCPRYGRSS